MNTCVNKAEEPDSATYPDIDKNIPRSPKKLGKQLQNKHTYHVLNQRNF